MSCLLSRLGLGLGLDLRLHPDLRLGVCVRLVLSSQQRQDDMKKRAITKAGWSACLGCLTPNCRDLTPNPFPDPSYTDDPNPNP